MHSCISRRDRCRSQPFATKERYGCGSAACRYTSARQNAPFLRESSANSQLPNGAMCASPPTSKEVTACGFAANSRRNSLHSAGRAEPRPYQLRLHFNGFCVKQTVYGLRVYLKTPNAPGQRAFLRCAASFFLEIRQYSCEKMSCATQKSLAAGHIMSFQIHPKLMTLPFRGSPGKLRGWQTFRRAYRLSPGHAPRGLVQTTGTDGGYD